MSNNVLARSFMKFHYDWHITCSLFLLCTALSLNTLWAAESVLAPDDSNTGISVVNAIALNGETQVFFSTWPNLGDPRSGDDCSLNFYRVPIRPGSVADRAVPVAREVCSGLIQKSRLLDDGSALIFTNRQLEIWRDGEKEQEYPFKALPQITRQGIVNDVGGPERLSISSAGHVVAALQNGQRQLDVVSLTALGEEAWRQPLVLEGMALSNLSLVASADGGVLLMITMSGLSAEHTTLHIFDGSGAESSIALTGDGDSMQASDLDDMTPEEMQAFYMNMATSSPATVKLYSAKNRADGDYDVLYLQKDGDPEAEGLYLLQLSPTGTKEASYFLGNILQDIGLDKWADFEVSGKELRLSGRVLAVQEGVEAKRDRYMQNVVSRIDLDSRQADSRLIPLDQRFLAAAMNAGDEERQYLPGLPGGQPVLITAARDKPVDVTIGMIKQRSVLRITEVSDGFLAWSPESDEHRLAELKAKSEPSQAEQAAALQQHLQSMSSGSFFETQIAEMEKMLDDPNLSAEQREQFEQTIERLRMTMPSENQQP